MVLTVPMDPAYLPESALLGGAFFAAMAALHYLSTRNPGKALRAAALGVGCVALAFLMLKTLHNGPKPAVLQPASKRAETQGVPPARTMSLVLGGVTLRVAPSDRYLLSVDGQQFLDLDLRRRGLYVSGVVSADSTYFAEITQNTYPYRRAGDSNTLVVQKQDRDVCRIRYVDPLRIEVTGQFFDRTVVAPAIISLQEGIHWKDGSLAPGTTLDLTRQGKGRIDFGRSGAVRVLRR